MFQKGGKLYDLIKIKNSLEAKERAQVLKGDTLDLRYSSKQKKVNPLSFRNSGNHKKMNTFWEM